MNQLPVSNTRSSWLATRSNGFVGVTDIKRVSYAATADSMSDSTNSRMSTANRTFSSVGARRAAEESMRATNSVADESRRVAPDVHAESPGPNEIIVEFISATVATRARCLYNVWCRTESGVLVGEYLKISLDNTNRVHFYGLQGNRGYWISAQTIDTLYSVTSATRELDLVWTRPEIPTFQVRNTLVGQFTVIINGGIPDPEGDYGGDEFFNYASYPLEVDDMEYTIVYGPSRGERIVNTSNPYVVVSNLPRSTYTIYVIAKGFPSGLTSLPSEPQTVEVASTEILLASATQRYDAMDSSSFELSGASSMVTDPFTGVSALTLRVGRLLNVSPTIAGDPVDASSFSIYQDDETLQPFYGPLTMDNGTKTLFDFGSFGSKHIKLSNSTATDLPSDAATFFYVCKFSSLPADRHKIISTSGQYMDQIGAMRVRVAEGTNYLEVCSYPSNASVNDGIATFATDFSVGVPYVIMVCLDTSSGKTLATARVNGVAYSSVVVATEKHTIFANQFTLSGNDNDSDMGFTGGIGELLYYPFSLTAASIHAVEMYLANKWGFFISGTPASLSTPTVTVVSQKATSIAVSIQTADIMSSMEYIVYYRLGTTGVWQSVRQKSSVVELLGLQPEKTYQIRAVTMSWGYQSSGSAVVVGSTPSPSPTVVVTARQPTSLTVAIIPSPESTALPAYVTIYYGTLSRRVAFSSLSSINDGTNARQLILSDLATGASYDVYAVAESVSGGLSAASNVVLGHETILNTMSAQWYDFSDASTVTMAPTNATAPTSRALRVSDKRNPATVYQEQTNTLYQPAYGNTPASEGGNAAYRLDVNGRQMMLFAPVNKSHFVTNVVASASTMRSEFAFFMIVCFTATNTTYNKVLCGTQGNMGATGSVSVRLSAAANVLTVSAMPWTVDFPEFSFALNTTYLISVIVTFSNGQTVANARVNGVDASGGARVLNSAGAISMNVDNFEIGGNNAAMNQFTRGGIGEVIYFSRAVTAEWRDAVEFYLQQKWGV